MTLKDAKVVRDFVKQYGGLWCIVPLGHGPDKYFARIYNCDVGNVDFQDMQSARDYLAKMLRRNRNTKREYDRARFGKLNKPRSPLEMMIDKACGYKP